jgi:energy-converting hydrogenase Eha subunit F
MSSGLKTSLADKLPEMNRISRKPLVNLIANVLQIFRLISTIAIIIYLLFLLCPGKNLAKFLFFSNHHPLNPRRIRRSLLPYSKGGISFLLSKLKQKSPVKNRV